MHDLSVNGEHKKITFDITSKQVVYIKEPKMIQSKRTIVKELEQLHFDAPMSLMEAIQVMREIIRKNSRKVKKERKQKCWWNDAIQKLYEDMVIWMGLVNSKPIPSYVVKFNRAQALFRRKTRETQKSNWNDRIESIKPQTSLQTIWNIVNPIDGKNTSQIHIMRCCLKEKNMLKLP